MIVVYSNNKIQHIDIENWSSIFLVGPTPRNKNVKSWRLEAIDILVKKEWGGFVLVPEPYSCPDSKSEIIWPDYTTQCEWEYFGLEKCEIIVTWVPRQLPDMPAFTTNIEFGRYVDSGRLYYGRPDGAPHTSYLDWMYKKLTGRQPHNNLKELISECLDNR